jgi:hypothetical protein
VALGVVERLDVLADLVDHLLRLLGLVLDVAYLLEELVHRRLGVRQVLAGRHARASLRAHGVHHLVVERDHVRLELVDVRVDARERLLRREEPVDVVDRVEVGLVQRVARRKHLAQRLLERGAEVNGLG